MLEIVSTVLAFITNTILDVISTTGYFGIFFLMTLESAVMPVPSEVVMPFSGYLVLQGRFNLWYVTLAGTLGNLAGSILAYVIGLYFGRGFILKYGKYVLLKKKYLLLSEKWFKKYGDKTIFFSRLLPVVRTVISLPAGIGRMNFKKFCIYTFVGSVPWNFALTYVGVWLGKNWNLILRYSHVIDAAIVAVLVVGVVWYLWRYRLNNRKV